MANSDFWRELAISFKSVPELYEFHAFRQYYMELQYFSTANNQEPIWKLGATPPALAEFRAMAVRGATMLPPLPTRDLAVRWLEALWKEATEGPVRSGIPIVGKDRTRRLTELRGTISRVFQASSALCRKFEVEALHIEFEENKQNDPRNWSQFRQQFEAFEGITNLLNSPAKTIPEEFVRNTIACIRGIKPEEVTAEQINFEVAGLLPIYPNIKLIHTVPHQESPPVAETKHEDAVPRPVTDSRVDPKTLRDSYLANFPDERIKLRDLCWAAGQHYREWKRWLAGELKDGSTPDLAFRRVLTSGKRPHELTKKPRPKGWE